MAPESVSEPGNGRRKLSGVPLKLPFSSLVLCTPKVDGELAPSPSVFLPPPLLGSEMMAIAQAPEARGWICGERTLSTPEATRVTSSTAQNKGKLVRAQGPAWAALCVWVGGVTLANAGSWKMIVAILIPWMWRLRDPQRPGRKR